MIGSRSEAIITSFLVAALCLVVQACRVDSTADDLPASYIRVVIDKSEPERLLSYYLGGYLSPEPADPFEAGVLVDTNRRLYVNLDSLERHYPGAANHLKDANNDNRIDWDEMEAFVSATYYDARRFPVTLDTLLQQVDFDPDDAAWMRVEAHGVMTTARRKIHVEKAALRSALGTYWENEERLIYPIGTVILGEHFLDDLRVEATVMRKREDGFWDFGVYGLNDSLAMGTSTPPKELDAPLQCVGCHFGSKLFEPERSFPAKAAPGPHGPRQLYVRESLRDAKVVRFFDEHRKRSDTILGIYNTLFVSDLRQRQREGILSEEDEHLLAGLAIW